MLFGKTTQQAQEATQKRLQALYGKRHRKLALWPVKLTDGRYAWLRWVWVEYPIIQIYSSDEYYNQWWRDKKYYSDSGLPPDNGHFLGVM